LLGVFRLAVDTPVQLGLPGFEHGYPQGSLLWIVNNLYFQYYSVLIALVCAVVMLAVSYATQAPSLEQIEGLTFATVTEEQRLRSRSSWDWRDIITSALVLVGIGAAYLYFTG
jgi:solute:Na+ symporter, SSS family